MSRKRAKLPLSKQACHRARDLAAFLALPATAYDACATQAARVSSLSLVCYRGNDYSVPVAYGHREALLKAYIEQVEIHCGTERIARHGRSYEKADFVFDPLHFLALLDAVAA